MAFPEPLEPRQLLAVVAGGDEQSAVLRSSGGELVVIDGGLAGHQGIVKSFGGDARILEVSTAGDLFADVSAALAAEPGISAIHLVGHGAPGRFSLASTVFDTESVDLFAAGLASWGRLAAPDADLYLWGCDIAGGDGASLVDTIHALSGLDVAASIDVTGPAALGGDFDLEYTAGDVTFPALAAGVDVLWDTTLAAPTDYSFSATKVKTAVASAFSRLEDDIAPAVQAALAAQVGTQGTDAYSQRTYSDLFTAATSVGPADVAAMLSLATTTSTYLAGDSPTLAGLATSLQTRLNAVTAAAGSGPASVTVTPRITANASDEVTKIELAVSLAATGTTTQPLDRGTDTAPTIWGRVLTDLDSAVGLALRAVPALESGTTFTGAFTVSVDLADPSAPVASIAIPTLDLAGGFRGHAPVAVRVGALDATLAAASTPVLATSVSFGGTGASRTVANWATVGASAAPLPAMPIVTVELPVAASLGGTAVTTGSTKVTLTGDVPGGTPPTVGLAGFERLRWFGGVTSEDIVSAVLAAGQIYGSFASSSGPLGFSVPFVQDRTLASFMPFDTVFQETVGDVIDITTTTTVNGQSMTGRPADMQTFGDFAAKFPALGFQPVYDSAAGTVSLQVSASRTESVAATPAVQFAIAPLGRLGFDSPPVRTVNVPVGLGFGVQFAVGPTAPIVLGLATAPVESGRLSSDVSLTLRPALGSALGSATTVTIRKADTDTNGSVDELIADVNTALAGTILRARRSEFGAGLELYTPTIDASMPTAVTLEAGRTTGAADLGFSDGLPSSTSSPITVFARAAGATATIVPHGTLPFATGAATVPLAGLAGAVTYGLNTLAFTGTSGSSSASVSIALPAGGGAAEEFSSDPSLLATTLVDSSSIVLSGLSRVGATNDVSSTATIGIRVDDFTAATVTGFAAVGVPLPVAGLEADGRTTGRLSADAAIQFTWNGTTYEATVPQAWSLDNTSFANLLDDFNVAVKAARIVTGGVAGTTMRDLSTDLSITGTGGRITVLCTSDTPATTVLSGKLVPNLAPGGATTGRLAEDATLSFVDGSTTYGVTVAKAATAGNTSFADLIADFNAARSTATRQVGTAAAEAYDAATTLQFTAGTGASIQPQVVAALPNPNYAVVAMPATDSLGEAGYQAKLSVAAVADAIKQATSVFTMFSTDLRDYTDVTWPLLSGPLDEYISFDTGLTARLATLKTLTASSPAELERAIERAMSLPTSDLAISFDGVRRAYRIDLAYRTSVARKIEFESDLLPYYEQLGRLPPKGIDQLIDGDAKTPLDLTLATTSVFSVGIDLATMRTFLYGHDGGQTAAMGDGTSFRIDVAVNGTKLEFPAEFGMFVKDGKASIKDGALVVTLDGPIGTAPSSQFFVKPQAGELAALAIANYSVQVTGKVSAVMPIFDEFAPATTTQQSIKDAQAYLKTDYDAIKKHPASFYLGIGDLGTYLGLADAIETAQEALAALRQSNLGADTAGVTLAQWQQRLDAAAADLPDALRVFAPELDNAMSLAGADNSIFDLVRDPAIVLDTLDTVLRLFENSLRSVNNLDLPLIGKSLGGAVDGTLGFRRGFLLDMRRTLRGAGQSFFDVARQGIFDALGPKGAGILLQYNGLNAIRSVEGMVGAQRPGDVGLTFFDEFGNELKNNVRNATAFEFNVRLGQKLFDTGIDLGFQLDALEPFLSLELDGGLRLQLGWDLSIGFGVDRYLGPYIKLDPDNPELQVRFDATLVGESAKYTQSWDATGGYWKIVDGNGRPVVDPNTNQPYRAVAVDKYGADVTASVPRVAVLSAACNVGALGGTLTLGDTSSYPTSGAITITDGSTSTVLTYTGNDTSTGRLSGVAFKSGEASRTYAAGSRVSLNAVDVTDECDCGETPRKTGAGAPIWWVVAAQAPSGNWLPAEFNDMRQYVPQDSPFVHTMIEVTNMAPARLTGGLAFLKLAAGDVVRRGLSNYSDFDAFYSFDTGSGPQVEAKDRDDKNKGVNRNNDLPTTFTGVVGVEIEDPSSKKSTYTAVKDNTVDPDDYKLADAKGNPVFTGNNSTPLREYYQFTLKQGPGADYRPIELPVRVATAANIDLQGVRIVDGVQLMVGDRVLVKNQTIAQENGIYRASVGRWERAFDADASDEFNDGKPLFVLITEGRTNKNTGWAVDDRIGSITLGQTPIVFTRVQSIVPAGLGLAQAVPYVPFTTVLLPKSMVDSATSQPILVNIFYDNANYLVEVPPTSSTGVANRAAQLTFALRNAARDENDNGRIDGDEGMASNRRNLVEAGYAFSAKASAKPKFYVIDKAELDKDGREKNPLSGTFVIGPDLWRPRMIGGRAFAIDEDSSKDRLTFTEMRIGGRDIFKVDITATAVVNLQLELFMSLGDRPDALFANVPRLYADLNMDWSSAYARYSVEQEVQKVQDAKDAGTPAEEENLRPLFEDEAEQTSTTGGDKGIDPASKLVTKFDFKPEVGISNVRLDLGEFLSDFLQPNLKRADPYLEKIRPVLEFLTAPVPVVSDIAGTKIMVVDLIEKFGGDKAKGLRAVVDVIKSVDNLVARIASLPTGANVQLPLGRFWFPKKMNSETKSYEYSDFRYDNVALGVGVDRSNPDAAAALDALTELRANNPDSPEMAGKNKSLKDSVKKGGIRVPLLDNPLTAFQLMMGQTAPLFTYQLPSISYQLDKSIPLARVVCFELGVRLNFQLDAKLMFGFDTYGFQLYDTSGDISDITQGFYVSDRANADGTGADVPEFRAVAGLALYGGVDTGFARAGVEGGVRVTAEVDLNDPNDDGKLRLTEALGLVIDTGNPLDLFDFALRGEAYASYYYDVLGIISGRQDFARIEIFNLQHDGSDGTPLYGGVINYEDKQSGTNHPGTLLLHVGENAAKRVSNQDPLKAKDGAERIRITNDGSTVFVRYLNYSDTKVRIYENVTRVVFDGGIGDDELDASGLNGIPLEFRGGDGNDTVILGSGHSTAASRIEGGEGNDRVTVTGGGLVSILGDLGNDTIIGGTGTVVIDAGGGDDSVTTGAGSTTTLLFGSQYGRDGIVFAADAAQNLLDMTGVPSAVEFLLTGGFGTAKAGTENWATFNVTGLTEIRGSTDADTFTLVNPRTRNANGGKGLLLRGGLGDDVYDVTVDDASGIATDGILVDDVRPVTAATAGAVTLCGTCSSIDKIAVASGGAGYTVAPEVKILDATGYGAKATATIDENGRVVSIQVIAEGRGYTSPTIRLVTPGSFNDKLVFSSVRPAAALSRAGLDAATYAFTVDGRQVRFVGVGPTGGSTRQSDTSEVDSVTVNLPEGVFTLDGEIALFDTFAVNASRMVQNARIVADTVGITTAHGFQIRHAIDTTFSGDIKIRVTGDGSATGEGEINAAANLATAVANVSGGKVAGLTLVTAGNNYFFDPSLTVGSTNTSAGTGARFAAARSGSSLAGFTQLAGGGGYFSSPAPLVVIPPPASIQVDATLTTSTRIDNVGRGDGRGRIILYADTGMVDTSGEVFFPTDTTPGAAQGSRVLEWIDGDFRYRTRTTLDDIVSPTTFPGVSVGTGAEFEAVLDADGRVAWFKKIRGGSGYTQALPPLVDVEGLATATPIVEVDGSIAGLAVTYPGDGYGQPPKVTIRPNGFGRVVGSPTGATLTAAGDQLLNRVHIRSMGGTFVAVGGAGVGDPLKPLKSDVETFVAQVNSANRGVHLLEKDGLRIGLNSGINGIRTVGGDVTVTTFGGALELGQPRQLVDANGSPLWQDLAKTIPIYDRDPVTGKIIYEGGQIAVGSGDVKLTADDIEVNVELNQSGGGGSIVLQPVKVAAEVGLAGTRARVGAVVTNGKLTGFDAMTFWGGRGYTSTPLVIVDPAGQRAFGSGVVQDGRITAIDVIYGGTNYDPDNPPKVMIIGGGASTNATAKAIVSPDGVISGFEVLTPGAGYSSAPSVSIESPGQALVQAVLDTAHPDPVTGRFAIKEFVITNAGRNYESAPNIEVAAPYDFTLDGDEITMFDAAFAGVVIGRIEGQHLFHSPEASFGSGVVLRAPRGSGTLDVAALSATGPVAIVGSGNTFHLDAVGPTVTGSSISIDDNVIVHAGVAGVVTATDGSIQIFGSGKGMIDGDPLGDDAGDDEDLVLAATAAVQVSGAIGSRWKLDDLTITSSTRAAVTLDQSVRLTGDLSIAGGEITIGGVVDVGGDLVIDASGMVAFPADVTVGGNLTITGATGVTFAGLLDVAGTVTIVAASGSVRFQGMTTVDGTMSVTGPTLVELAIGLDAAGDVTLVGDAIDLLGGTASVVGAAGRSLTLRPSTASRAVRVGSPVGGASGTLDVSDTDLAAIAAGWGGVVIGDATAGTGAVTVGSIGATQGGKNSWLSSATTIVGGSVTVTQKVDVAATAGFLKLVARTGDVTVNAAVNETVGDRNPWVFLEADRAITLAAPVSSAKTISLVAGSTVSQTGTAPLATGGLRVTAGGTVSLEASGNAFGTLAVGTKNAAVAIREDSGYSIGTVDGVSGVTTGTATATLVSSGTVTQAQPIETAMLMLNGAGGDWTLTGANTIGTLSADTGRLSVADVASIIVGKVVASAASSTALSIAAPGGISLTDTITTLGGDVVFLDAVVLAGDVVIDVATGAAWFQAAVEGTTSGQESLSITGNLVTSGSVGAVTALKSLSVSGTSSLAGGTTLRTSGGQTYTGTVTSAGVVTVRAGVGSAVTFLGDVAVGGLVTTGEGYDVSLTGSVTTITEPVTFLNTGVVTLGDGGDALTFNGGLTSTAPSLTKLGGAIATSDAAATFGTTTLAAATTVSTGTGAATFSGTVDGGESLAVNSSGTTTFTKAVGGTTALMSLTTNAGGTTAIDGGAITTSGAAGQVLNDAVTLGANTVLAAAAGAVTFATTLDGGYRLDANTTGATTFGGAVGTKTALTHLETNAGGTTAINGGSITTSSDASQVYNDAVTLGANTVLEAASGGITFNSALDGAYSLAANTTATTTFNAVVGGTMALVSLSTNAGGTTAINGGAVTTSGAAGQVYGDAVSLGANTILDAAAGAITFSSTLDGGYSLDANTTGTTSFNAAVGGMTAVASLATNAGGTTAINGGAVTTSGLGGQVYGDAVSLGANTVLEAASGAITFSSTLDGGYTLDTNTTGMTSFNAAVGGTTALASLATNAGGTTAINGGAITTSGAAGQVFHDAVTLGVNTVLAAASGAITFSSTLDGGYTLDANTTGTTAFNGVVGGTTPVASLSTNTGGTTAINGGAITTSGAAGQVYGDAVSLGSNTVLAAAAGAVTFATTLDGGYRLDVNTTGATTFGGAVGSKTALTHLETNAGGTTAVNGGSVTTASAASQVYGDAVSLGANTVLAAATGAITFNSTLDGEYTLDANTTGTTTFNAAVGGTKALVSLSTNAGGTTAINGGAVTTSGAAGQVYGDAVSLGSNAVLAAASGAITFATTLDGSCRLDANTTGMTTFGGGVGTVTALESLSTNAGGTTVLNGGMVRTSGGSGQVYGDAVSLGAATVLNAAAGAITLGSTVDGAFGLTARTTGVTTFSGGVGTTTPLASLVTNPGGTTVLAGGQIKTSDAAGQVFNDAVTLGSAMVLNAGAGIVTLGSTVDGAFALVARTTGITTFRAAVGGTTPLVSLVTNPGGTTAINGGSFRTTGTQRYSDPVTLGTNASFVGSGATFGAALLGPGRSLTIGAGGDGVAFLGDVGAASYPLGAIDVTSVGGVAISGDIFSTGPVTIRSTSGVITMTDWSVIDAGSGTIDLAASGSIALAGLTTTNATAAAVQVTSTGGAITDAGDTDTDIVAARPGAVVTLRAATGIGSGNALEIVAAGVTAAVTGSGDVGLAGIGDLVVLAGGLSASGAIDLAASGRIVVPTGGGIAAGTRVTATGPIVWSVMGNADTGPGSLRQVIANANATGVEGVAEFPAGSTLVSPASPLPAISTKFTLDGTGRGVVLDGGDRVATGLTLSAGAAGSVLRGLTVRGFTATGIVLDAVTGTLVSGCVIQANGNGLAASGSVTSSIVAGNTFMANRGYGIQLTAARGLAVDSNLVTGVNTASSMGLYATGDLAGTTITATTFSGGLRGALLDSAKNLVFGMVGRGNSLLDNRSAPGTSFAGTGIRAQGDLTGTTVRANTFAGNNYGMAFVNARNLVFGGTTAGRGNTITTSSIAAVFIEGDCTGSSATGTTYGTGPQANARKIQRVSGAKGL